jgi:threonine dehydrogenase-like Zn-dependent dehydrogenase
MPAERLYPTFLSIKELCLVGPLTIGFHAAVRGRVTAEDAVAIFGCGVVGLGAISACHFSGARTIVVDVDDAKLEVAGKAGASHIINSRKGSLHQALVDLTDGHGPDVVIEAIGLPETFRAVEEEVTAIVPLEEAPRVLQEWSDNPGRFTKIMVNLS